MSHDSAKLRLFAAIYPSEDAVRAMLRALRKLSLPSHRETPPAQVHMTVQFIGQVDRRDLDEVLESVRRSASGIRPFELRAERLITLPRRGRPRLVAAELNAPAELLELHRRLAHRLARHLREKPGDRFLPHMTLCRFSHGKTCADIDVPIAGEPFTVSAVSVMKSILRPEGAVHEEVERIELSG